MTIINKIARWVTESSFSDIPEDVVKLLIAQRKSVLGAISASTKSDQAKKVSLAALKTAEPGNFKVSTNNARCSLYDAIYWACINSIALDFDDYMCFGHTGHSSVITSLYLGALTKAPVSESLTAQFVANEVAARLGGSCLIGPQNGQLWSFIHSVSAATAASKLLKLTEKQTANAIALSLYQPHRATPCGFFSSDSKLLTAAEPTIAGLKATLMAKNKVEGPLDCLDREDGFFSAFSFVPLKEMLETFNAGFLTKTLAIKRYPGCAYVDPAIDAIEQLRPQIESYKTLSSIVVNTNLITFLMDQFGSRSIDFHKKLDPVNINFSLKLSCALALFPQGLSPTKFSTNWITRNKEIVEYLYHKIEVKHNNQLSADMTKNFSKLINMSMITSKMRPSLIASALLGGFRSPFLSRTSIVRQLKQLAPLIPNLVGNLATIGSFGHQRTNTNAKTTILNADNIDSFSFEFPTEVVFNQGEKQLIEFRSRPEGSPNSHFSPIEAANEKLNAYGVYLFKEDLPDVINSLETSSENIYSYLIN